MCINGDHLGNVRLTYKDSNGNGSVSTSEIIEEKNYYPFGLQHKGYNSDVSGNVNSVAQNFGYNGKENNPELGLEFMDFGARNYDAAIGRWMNIDPLADQMRRHSPYNFAFDNPVFFIDPDGMMPCPHGDCGGGSKNSQTQNAAIAVKRKAQGLWNSVKTIGTAVASGPGAVLGLAKNTIQGVGNALTPVAQGFIDDGFSGAASAVGDGMVANVKSIASEEGISNADAAFVFGDGIAIDVGLAVATEGATSAVVKGATTAVGSTSNTTKVFRAFGGDAKPGGFSWTPKDPRGVADFRDAAGLPSGGASGSMNTAESLIEGTVNNSDIINTRSALPLDGNSGGLPELIIDPKNVSIDNVTKMN